MYNGQLFSSVLLVLYATNKLNDLFACFNTVSVLLTVLRSSLMVLRKLYRLCYKSVIAIIRRRIKDYFSLVFSKFSQIALVAQFGKLLKCA